MTGKSPKRMRHGLIYNRTGSPAALSPFSDLSQSKYRSATILADAGRGEWVLCQITSNPYADPLDIKLDSEAFASGALQRVSNTRPSKLFTANESLLSGIAVSCRRLSMVEIVEQVVCLLRGDKSR